MAACSPFPPHTPRPVLVRGESGFSCQLGPLSTLGGCLWSPASSWQGASSTGENPIWSKSVESRDGARTGRPAPPPRRTSPGRRPLPGTVIGPAPRGRPRTESPHPRPALSSSSQQSPPLQGALVFLLLSPTAVPFPNLAPFARSRAPGASARLSPRSCGVHSPCSLPLHPFPQTSPRSLLPLLLRRPHL